MYGDDYVENDILTEEPLELVLLLYAKALEQLRHAAGWLEADDLPAFTAGIGRAMEVVAELRGALSFDRGGDIAANLASLYVYVLERLTAAITEKQAEPVRESIALLTTLQEGWNECRAREPREAAAVPVGIEQTSDQPNRVWTL
jgi:flagellar protein FliS